MEGVLEELDAPGEWLWVPDTPPELVAGVLASAGTLYLWYNASAGTPPPAGAVSLTQLERLVVLTGSSDAPVVSVTLDGLTFTASQPTYLTRPFRAPSGGDWSFAETAALVAEGTAGLVVSNCVFERLGGNGILLHGQNNGTSIVNSSFSLLGDSGVVLCGNANLADLSTAQVIMYLRHVLLVYVYSGDTRTAARTAWAWGWDLLLMDIESRCISALFLFANYHRSHLVR